MKASALLVMVVIFLGLDHMAGWPIMTQVSTFLSQNGF